jgi:ketosteroid isomerase-like protein
MLTGGCLCGAVRFEIDGAVGPITCCHCSKCRRASGSAFVTAASVDAAAFRVTAGDNLVGDFESSPQNHRAFCTRCGSQLWGRHDEYPIVRVRAGGLDDDPGSRVAAHMMMSSKAEWLEDGDDAVEEFAELAPISYFLPDATIAPRRAQRARPNVEVVQRAYEAFARRELRTILGLFSEDVEILQASEIPWGGRYEGHAGAAAFFGTLIGAITSAVTFERFIDAGDQVIAIGRTRGTVNATGAAFDVPVAHVWTVHEGLITRVEYYIDDPTMLRALG